MKNSDTSME